MSSAIDTYVLYKIIKDLSTPFKEMEIYDLGLIDENGKKIKSAVSREEKKAYSYYNKFIVNIKRLLDKVGLGSKTATFAAALFFLKEHTENKNKRIIHEDEILTEIVANMKKLEENKTKEFESLMEEIANVTGNAVAGTGDSGVTWKKHPYKVGLAGDRRKKGRYINGVAFLKRVAKEKNKKKDELK